MMVGNVLLLVHMHAEVATNWTLIIKFSCLSHLTAILSYPQCKLECLLPNITPSLPTGVEPQPARPRGRKPAAWKAVTKVPEEVPAAKTSAAAEAVTEAPTGPEDLADSAVVQSQLVANHASS